MREKFKGVKPSCYHVKSCQGAKNDVAMIEAKMTGLVGIIAIAKAERTRTVMNRHLFISHLIANAMIMTPVRISPSRMSKPP